MTDEGVADDLQVLRSRLDVVEALRESPRQKPELDAALECSRSTITRAIRDLEAAGMLRRGVDGYLLTPYGRLLHDRYDRFLAEAGAIAEARPLLEALEPDAPVDLALLAEADVAVTSPPAAYEPLTEVRARLESAGRVRGVVHGPPEPTTLSVLVDQVDAGLVGELVVDPSLRGSLRDRDRNRLDELRAADRFGIVVGETLPYTLLVCDDRSGCDDGIGAEPAATPASDAATVVAIVADDHGDLRGTIVAAEPAAVAWATDRIDACARDAVPVGEQPSVE